MQKYIGEGIESPAWLEALQEQLFGFTGSRMVRELFVMAREHAPTIHLYGRGCSERRLEAAFVAADCARQVDSIGSSRVEGESGGDSEVQRTMLELLNQLDGFEAVLTVRVLLPLCFPGG